MNKLRKDKTAGSIVETINLGENTRRAKIMAVSLAFAIAAADKKISDNEVKVIESWARNNIAESRISNRVRFAFNKMLSRTIALFPNYNRNRVYAICKEITETTSLAVRCNILDLCLHVVRANGIAVVEQLALLKNAANLLEIRMERFRSMMEKTIPACIHETEDMEITLGITAWMNQDQARQHLSQEYRKWNARVTNSSHEIKTQAEHMLQLIAEVRSQYAE